MKLEFLMCGSPTDAFWSMAAMYRLALDSLGQPYSDARQVLYLGAPGPQEIPDRWKRWVERIDVRWTDAESFEREGDNAQGYQYLRAVDPSADLSIVCDADTLLVDRLPEWFLEDFTRSPAVTAVIAHKPPPLSSYPTSPLERVDHDDLWNELAHNILGRPIPLTGRYNLTVGTDRAGWRCPAFYINFGFIATTPQLLNALADEIDALVPEVQKTLDNDFCDQIAVAYGVERAGIPHRLLPVRFNFPNDRNCDRAFPEEVQNLVVVHYLRRKPFERHKIFTSDVEFDRFMNLSLTGSNAVLQDTVRRITGGRYPFDDQGSPGP